MGDKDDDKINQNRKVGLSSHLAIRSFSKEDDHACCMLDLRANQFKNTKFRSIPLVGPLYGLLEDSIQVYPAYTNGFDAMGTEGAAEHEILVCQDNNKDNAIVGVIACNIRTVLWSAGDDITTTLKTGWIHGLRVDEDYQRMGIGTALSEALEARCVQRGVSLLYLTVNNDNEKALALYARLGYALASDRAVRAQFLAGSTPSADSDLLVVPLVTPPLAATLTGNRYQKIDLSPATPDGFLPLVASRHFERSFVAVPRSELPPSILEMESNGEEENVLSQAVVDAIQSGSIPSYGGVSIWNGSAFKRFRVIRIFFRKETWLSLPFRWSLALGLTSISGHWWHSLLHRSMLLYRSDSSTRGWWPCATLAAEGFAAVATSAISYVSYRFFRFLTGRDTSRFIARAFAPFGSGPQGNDCLRGALAESKTYAKERGYGLWILNVADGHPDEAVFGAPGFRTTFRQKWLVPPPPMGGTASSDTPWNAFSPASFCDPRDY